MFETILGLILIPCGTTDEIILNKLTAHVVNLNIWLTVF